MELARRSLLGAFAVGATGLTALPRLTRAQAANTIRIGVMNDMSGTYKDNTGPGSVACARQAIEEFGNQGFNVELIFADHQNKPDVGVALARQWYDQGVDMILDVPTSSVGLAVQNVSKEKNKVAINVGSATSDLTGAQCSPSAVHWAYDTYQLARTTGGATVAAGGDVSRVMDDAGVARFIAHYERITRHLLAEMPARADILVTLDAARQPTGLRGA